MNWEQRSVPTNDGAELAVWVAGPHEGEAVLLIHGFSLDHTTFGPVAETLVARGFRIVAPDLRGHGGSTLGPVELTMQHFVNDVAEVMGALDVPAAHMVGHSFGAVVVLAARADPRIAASIKTATSIAGTERAIQNVIMKLGVRVFNSAFGIALLRRRRSGRIMISSWFGKTPKKDDLDWIRQLSAACDPATRSAVASATGDLDLRPTFSLAGPPTLVLCGQRDRATPAKVSKRIASAIDGAEIRLAEGAGHMVIIEDDAFVSEQVAAWIAQHS